MLRSIAESFAADVDVIAEDVARHTLTIVAQLGGLDDQDARALTYGVARANIGSMATMLEYGVPLGGIQPPQEAIEWALTMLRRGVELSSLMRAYRVGHGRLWTLWMRRAHDAIGDPHLLAEVLEASSEFMFAWIDATAVQLVEEYGHERERWLAGAAAVRTETARGIVEGATPDVDAASARLRYELRRHHVAIIGWIPGSDGDAAAATDSLHREGTTLARTFAGGEPLVVPAGRGLVWIWTGSFSPIVPADPAERADAPSARFAIGEPGEGLDGFRRSHAQAERVRRLLTASASGRPVVRYAQVALAATLCVDLAGARTFARDELAGLAGADPALRRLRETLTVYLETGSSPLHTAERLGVHAKTVAYRMRRVEEILGRPIAARRAELEAALLVEATLGED